MREFTMTDNNVNCLRGFTWQLLCLHGLTKTTTVLGDLPARAFEAGHAGPSSNYPCVCGMQANCFGDADKILQAAPFNSISKRKAVFGRKAASFQYEPDQMKVGAIPTVEFKANPINANLS